jgi:hypothetical protein
MGTLTLLYLECALAVYLYVSASASPAVVAVATGAGGEPLGDVPLRTGANSTTAEPESRPGLPLLERGAAAAVRRPSGLTDSTRTPRRDPCGLSRRPGPAAFTCRPGYELSTSSSYERGQR